MDRRAFLQGAVALGLLGPAGARAGRSRGSGPGGLSVEALPELAGDLTVYLGRGEGGLYQDVMEAIRKRSPKLDLQVRRGPSTSLANTIVAEARAGVRRADLFWSIDSSSIGLVAERGLTRAMPAGISSQLKSEFRYQDWAPISGRVRTVAYNPERVREGELPDDIMAFADSDFAIGWAPAYGAFQSFVTAMRLLEGKQRTRDWLRGVKARATSYAGELGVVMAAARGEVDLGFANHYYTLRLKQGMPDASVAIAFTSNDAGSLVNASGAALLSPGETPADFVRYLLSREVQGYLAREAFEIPLVPGVAMPEGLPPLDEIDPPDLDLTRLAEIRPTLELMRDTGVL